MTALYPFGYNLQVSGGRGGHQELNLEKIMSDLTIKTPAGTFTLDKKDARHEVVNGLDVYTYDSQSLQRRERKLRELASDLADMVEAGLLTDTQANEWHAKKADDWK